MLVMKTKSYVSNQTLACFAFQYNEKAKPNATGIYRYYDI